MTLRDKVALVTGSTGGIGFGIARALAEAGADVMLHGLGDPQRAEHQRAALKRDHAVRVGWSGADLADAAGVRRLVADTEAALGPVDILVNNAGIQFVAAIDAFPEERWDAVLAVNLSAAFHATKAASPGMASRGWGRIVNIASAHGLVASPGKAAYVAAKHGLVGLTKVAAVELAGRGVTCNAICPGWVETPLVAAQIAERASRSGTTIAAETEALLAEKQPLRRFSTPDQIGALTVFLCSAAADTITGASLPVDGGWTAV